MGYPKTTQWFRKYFSHTFLISCRYVFPIFNCQSWTKPSTIFRWHGNPQRLCPLRFGRKMSLTTHWANLMDLLDVKLRFFPYLVMLAYWMVYDGIWMIYTILVIYIACVFSMPCIFINFASTMHCGVLCKLSLLCQNSTAHCRHLYWGRAMPTMLRPQETSPNLDMKPLATHNFWFYHLWIPSRSWHLGGSDDFQMRSDTGTWTMLGSCGFGSGHVFSWSATSKPQICARFGSLKHPLWRLPKFAAARWKTPWHFLAEDKLRLQTLERTKGIMKGL